MKTRLAPRCSPILLATLLLLANAGLLATSCAKPKSAPVAGAPASRAKVVFLEGQVTLNGKAAELGMEVGGKLAITTGPASTCDLTFDGRNALHVGPSTVADLDLSQVAKEVRIEKGGMAFVLKQLQKVAGSDSFRVNTPSAIAGVRGTTFCVWVGDGQSYVCACNGSVETIDPKGGNEEVLTSAHHLARLYTAKGSTFTKAPAGLEYHDDASVQTLAGRIGYTIDWTKAD